MFSIGTNGQLTPLNTPSIATQNFPGFMAVHPAGKYAYTLGSNHNISMYSIGNDGILAPLSTPSIILNDGTDPTGMAIDSAGRFVFTAAYGYGISSFAIGSNGILTPPAVPMSTDTVRGFAISH